MGAVSEKDVEVKLIANLFANVLGYPETELRWNVPVAITQGRETRQKFADLVAYRSAKAEVVVEAKRPTESVSTAIDQVDSYAFALQARYSVVTNGHQLIVRGYFAGNTRINLVDTTIDELRQDGWRKLENLLAYNIVHQTSEIANDVAPPDRAAITDYRRFFKRVHNQIRDLDKLDPAAAFDELSKLMFMVAAEDLRRKSTTSGEAPFLTVEMIDQWLTLDRDTASKFIDDWYLRVTRTHFPSVSDEDTKINLSPSALKLVLTELRKIDFFGGDGDIKGRAFEEFLPSQLRGKGLGQFFTPRPIVDFMVELADISIQDVVVDFACGSGGFLIKSFEKMRKGVDQLPKGTLDRLGTSREELLNDITQRQLFGIDAEPRAARTAKMNMLMWGDGRRVVRGNGLAAKDHNGESYEVKDYDPKDPDSGCTLILANPPFGSQEKDKTVLKQYVLGSRLKATKSQKTEVLFLERGLRLLRPEGRMLIVLPQGLLSGSSYERVRGLILSQAEVRAIVSLPTHTFSQSGVPTLNTCVLYVQKFSEAKLSLFKSRHGQLSLDKVPSAIRRDTDFDHEIFMATAEHIGYEPSGRSILGSNEKSDLDLLLEDYRDRDALPPPNVDLYALAEAHYGARSHSRVDQIVRGTVKDLKSAMIVKASTTDDRLDPPYYLFRERMESILKDVPVLGDSIKASGTSFPRPTNDINLDKEYKILAVSTDKGVTLSGVVKGEDISQRYKVVHTGDIAYNPMRANIGSFGVVPESLDGGLISPDYHVVKSTAIDPEFLINVLKTPFYRMYIDVFSTGSIRDRLLPPQLRKLRVPRPRPDTQSSLIKASHDAEAALAKALLAYEHARSQIIADLRKMLAS